VSSNTAIRYFRHAVSLDERRAKFKANLYNRPTEAENKLGVQPGEMPTPIASAPTQAKKTKWDFAAHAVEALETFGKADVRVRKVDVKAKGQIVEGRDLDDDDDEDGKDEDEDSDDADAKYDAQFHLEQAGKKPETDVEEVWFAGCHCGQLFYSIIQVPIPNLVPLSSRCRRRFRQERHPS
jgi:hypothetical protein